MSFYHVIVYEKYDNLISICTKFLKTVIWFGSI